LQRKLLLLGGWGYPPKLLFPLSEMERGTRGGEVETYPGLRPPLPRWDGFPPEFTLPVKTTEPNRLFWAPPPSLLHNAIVNYVIWITYRISPTA